jgi:catechol 2,3-dioxygenase
LGLNTWAGVGAPPPPAETIRLEWFEIRLPDTAALNQLAQHLSNQGVQLHERGKGYFVDDPSHNRILLTVVPEPTA